jgi:hypothetical protein
MVDPVKVAYVTCAQIWALGSVLTVRSAYNFESKYGPIYGTVATTKMGGASND